MEQAIAYWVYGDSGDIAVSGDTSLVTTSGLVPARELCERRDPRSIGRMHGAWPQTETPSGALNRKHPATGANQWDEGVGNETIRARIKSLSIAGTGRSGVHRIGSHPRLAAEAFQFVVVEAECELLEGPCGWSWLVARKPARKAVQPKQKTTTVENVLCLWKPGLVAGTYSLPIEAEHIRLFTYALLHGFGHHFIVDYRPRYFPVEVSLQFTEAKPHSSIQGVLPEPSSRLIDITLASPGYPVVGGFLCSQ